MEVRSATVRLPPGTRMTTHVDRATVSMTPRGALLATIWVVIVLACIARFAYLEESPPGVWIDEAIGFIHMLCVAETGSDAYGARWPLFSPGYGGGFASPALIYGGALWSKLFGPSVQSLRALFAFVNVLAMIGLFLLVRVLVNPMAATWATLAAALSPWGFLFSRIGWDQSLTAVFVVWGLYFFLRADTSVNKVCSGIILGAGLYIYEPMRAHVPLLILIVLVLGAVHRRLTLRNLLFFVAAFALVATPVTVLTLRGTLQQRFHGLTILGPLLAHPLSLSTFIDVLKTFLTNLATHFQYRFLFLTGDANLRHSTHFSGLFGWLDAFALVTGAVFFVKRSLWRRTINWQTSSALVLAVGGLVASFVAPALTWEGLPHAGRSVSGWPFVAILTGVILEKVTASWRAVTPVAVTVAVVFAALFWHHLLYRYPDLSAAAFVAPQVERARAALRRHEWSAVRQAASPGLGELDVAYLLMAYGGETCEASKRHARQLLQGSADVSGSTAGAAQPVGTTGAISHRAN